MKKFRQVLDLEKLKPIQLVCYSEIKDRDLGTLGEGTSHFQTPKKIIISYVNPGIMMNSENQHLLHLMHTDIAVETECEHCKASNIYPDFIFLKESMTVENLDHA